MERQFIDVSHLHHNAPKEVAEYFSSLVLSEFLASVKLGSIM
jgi:hypothetical protein